MESSKSGRPDESSRIGVSGKDCLSGRPDVSIILPCRDPEPALLTKAVDSVLAQTHGGFELIIVDDGSDTRFKEAFRREAERDDRIRLIEQEPSGVSAARNHGIREAKGRYISLLDADDTVSPWFLEEALAAAKALSADYLIGGTCYLFIAQAAAGQASTGQPHAPARRIKELDPIRDAIELTRDRLPQTKAECIGAPYRFDENAYINRGIAARLVKREILTDQYLFPKGLRIAEDASWNLTLVSSDFRGFYVPGIWYNYLENENSVSNRYNPNVIRDMEDHLAVIARQIDMKSDIEYRAYMDLMMDDLRYISKCMVNNPSWKAGKEERRDILAHLYRDLPWKRMGEARYRKLAAPRDRFKAVLYRMRLLFAFWSLKKGA